MAVNLEGANQFQHGHIDDTIVPGTVHLVDVGQNMQAKHSKAHQDIVLVPTPSDDPDDPVSPPSAVKERDHMLMLCTAQLEPKTETSVLGMHVCVCCKEATATGGGCEAKADPDLPAMYGSQASPTPLSIRSWSHWLKPLTSRSLT